MNTFLRLIGCSAPLDARQHNLPILLQLFKSEIASRPPRDRNMQPSAGENYLINGKMPSQPIRSPQMQIYELRA
jgi:hypothetical protein